MAGSSELEGADEGEEEEETRSDGFRSGKEDPPITDYEKERLKTIQRNRDVLTKFQVRTLVTSLELFSQSQSKKNVGMENLEGAPRRRSQRLSTLKTNSSPKVAPAAEWSSGSSSEGEEGAGDDLNGHTSKPHGKQQDQRTKKKKLASLAELEGFEMKQEDEEYEPSGNSDSEDSSERDEELSSDVPQSRKRKASAKGPNVKALKSPVKRPASLSQWSSVVSLTQSQLTNSIEDEEEFALQQALALSLGSSMDTMPSRARDENMGDPSSKTQEKQAATKANQKRPSNKRGKERYFNQSEIDAFFCSIVGSLEGKLSLRHLESATSDQNFTWTEEELEDMIVMFDKDDDGQLNLAEFRSMAQRCELMDAC